MTTFNYGKTIALASAAAGLLVLSAVSAEAADATAGAGATVTAPIAISQTAALEFGSVASQAGAAGTVVIDTAGNRSSGDVDLLSGANPAAGAFAVTGTGNTAFGVVLPTTPVTLNSGADTISVGSFVSSVGASSALSSGNGSFTVGASLNLGAAQATGTYSGSYTVTVAYE